MSNSEYALNIVILDNDLSLSAELVKFINSYGSKIKSLKSFHDPLSAIQSLRTSLPDLIFLNVDSKDYHGLDVLRLLPPGIEQRVVFIADHEKIGNEAVRLGVSEYLVRPIQESEVRIVLDQQISKNNADNLLNRVSLKNKLLINKQDRAIIINVDDIVFLEAEGPYTYFNMLDQTVIKSSKSLGYYLKILSDKNSLIKVNRSFIVNFDHIKELVKDSSGEGILVLSNNQRIEFSSNLKKKLMQGIQEIINNSIRG